LRSIKNDSPRYRIRPRTSPRLRAAVADGLRRSGLRWYVFGAQAVSSRSAPSAPRADELRGLVVAELRG
jgi:hypothetical protein